jgi:hypothetical protein
MIVIATKLDDAQYAVQYELLRSQVIGPAGTAARGDASADQPRGVGLALLLSEGMPGWLKTVETVFRTALAPRAADSRGPVPHEGSPQSSAAPVWLSNVQRQEVSTLLASLVLSTRPVEHESTREEYRSW